MHTLWLAKTLPSGISLWRLPCKKWIFRQRSALINGKCIAHSSGSAGLPLHLHNYKSYYCLGGGMVRILHTQFNFISMYCFFFALCKNMATIEKSNQTERQGQKTVTTIYIIFHKKGATLFFFLGRGSLRMRQRRLDALWLIGNWIRNALRGFITRQTQTALIDGTAMFGRMMSFSIASTT